MSVIVKDAGGSGAAEMKLTFKEGTKMTYQSGSTTDSSSCTALKDTRVMIVFGRSNRNTGDTITWKIKKNGTQIESFTAETGVLNMQEKHYDLTQGDVLTAEASGVGYAGGHCSYVAFGKNAIS